MLQAVLCGCVVLCLVVWYAVLCYGVCAGFFELRFLSLPYDASCLFVFCDVFFCVWCGYAVRIVCFVMFLLCVVWLCCPYCVFCDVFFVCGVVMLSVLCVL